MIRFRSPSFLLLCIGVLMCIQISWQYENKIQLSQYPTLMLAPLPCGYYRLEAGNLFQIASSNYGSSVYSNSDSCVWRFSGDACTVNVQCPCFDIPASFQCIGDYLKFTDTVIYNQKFCGDVHPQGFYRTVTGLFRIRFRSDATRSGKGFLCYVGCSAPGQADLLGPIPNSIPQNPLCYKQPPPITTTTVVVPGTSGATVISTTPVSGSTPSIASTTPTGSIITSIPPPPTTPPPAITTSTTLAPTIRPEGMVPGLPGSFISTTPFGLKLGPGCRGQQRQVPVGETVRETNNKPVKPSDFPYLPPPWWWWCLN